MCPEVRIFDMNPATPARTALRISECLREGAVELKPGHSKGKPGVALLTTKASVRFAKPAL